MAAKINNIVVISDTHFGSAVALNNGCRLDDGGWYKPSSIQKKLWNHWENFWDWTYDHIKKEPFILVHNGDIIDGIHHRITNLVSHNLTIQSRIAIQELEPHIAKSERYYQVRGTEAHVGQAAQEEEAIAASLGAVQDKESGCFSRWEMWMKFCGKLIHFSHHIGTTRSAAYESSAPMREIVAAFVESGQWNMRPPDFIVRSHAHRYIKVEPPNCCIVVTPGWQLRTPLTYKIDRMRGPMFGGLLIRNGNYGVYTKEKIYTIKATEAVTV